MKLSGDGVTRVNKEYKSTVLVEDLNLNVGSNGYWSNSIYNGNWMVCRIDEISAMIKELTAMKEAIENTTGVML
jgi:hypothetical protein